MGSTPQSIQSLLHIATPDIADILGRARFLARMRAAVLDILPEAAAPHVQIASYEKYRLRLHVSNASWGTRLRYMQPAIAQALAQRMRLHIETVDIRVRPVGFDATPTPRPPRVLSQTSRAHIRQVADHIDDAELAAALTRLAAAGRTPGQP